MVTREAILQALDRVEDPELRQSIVKLGMVEDIQISPTGAVAVTVALTIAGCPLKEEIRSAVEMMAGQVPGVTAVEAHLTTMAEEKRQQLFAQLRGPEPAKPPLLQPGSKTVIIGIASGKGGVGKSTVAINLAHTLANLGYDVGLMDCDMYGASVPHMLGALNHRLPIINDLIIPVHVAGVKMISMSLCVPDNQPVIWRGPMLSKMLNTFFHEVHWGEPDFLFLDMPPGTGDVALDVHHLVPQCQEIIVTTPHPAAAHVAYRAGRMAIDTGHKILGIVENMAYYRSTASGQQEYVFGQGGGDHLAELLSAPVLARVPLGSPRVGETEIFAAGSEAEQVFVALAKKVATLTKKKRAKRAARVG
ncbi:MAG: Mrp/NBP35 family ATP-binding protein [Chloroflexi bacterium]|nr:Mrp/NBP35 family ATP-binding protein [Chloroflexota bacterium]